MTSRTYDGYASSRKELGTWLVPVKVMLSVFGTILVCLLITLRVLPTFRISTILLFIASASFMLVKGRGAPDLLHPVRVFGALWCFCLALADMRLMPMLSDWGYVTWSCFITGLLSFVGGFWLAKRFAKRREGAQGPTFEEEISLPNRKALALAALCLAIGTAVLAYEYHLIGEIPILSANPDAARMRLFGVAGTADPQFDKLYIKLLHPLVEFIKYSVFLIVIVLCQKKPKSRREILLSVLLIIFGTLALSSQAGRGFFVNIAITSVVLLHYLRRRVRLVELGAAGLALFVLLGFFASQRLKSGGTAPLLEKVLRTSSLPEGAFWDGITVGYATFTESFEVFHRLTDDLRTTRQPSSGFLFYALHRFLPRADIQQFDQELYTGEIITPTFLGEFYGDYRYWGVLFGPLVLGLGYGWAYSRISNQHRMYWIYVRALLIQILVFFPYVNLFSQYLTWIFDLFFMYMIIRYLTKHIDRPLQPVAGTRVSVYLPT